MCNHELKRLFYTSDDDYGIQSCRVELENEDDKYTLCYCEKCGQVFVMEINLDKLLDKKVGKLKYKEISKFPNVKKDVAFVMEKNMPSKEVETVIKKAGGNTLTKIEVFDVYTGENVGENEKSIAYSLTFNDAKKTLTEDEVMAIFNKIIENVEKKCNAKLRS